MKGQCHGATPLWFVVSRTTRWHLVGGLILALFLWTCLYWLHLYGGSSMTWYLVFMYEIFQYTIIHTHTEWSFNSVSGIIAVNQQMSDEGCLRALLEELNSWLNGSWLCRSIACSSLHERKLVENFLITIGLSVIVRFTIWCSDRSAISKNYKEYAGFGKLLRKLLKTAQAALSSL